MSGLQVVVPLAGLGTRLRPHTHVRPKPLLSVAGKPILGHIVDQLAGIDVDEVIFIVGHLGDQIERWAAESCPYPAAFVEQKELRGQAHAISLVGARLDRPTLIIFGDTIFEADLTRVHEGEHDGMLFVQEVADPRRFGIAVVGADGIAQRLVEKPKEHVGNLAVVGIYHVRDPRALMRGIDQVIARDQQIGGEFYLADALQAMIEGGARFRVGPTPVWADCGTVDALLATNRFLLAHGHDQPPAQAVASAVIQPVNVHPTATIQRSVVGPNVSIAAGVTVTDSIIQDSIVNENVRIENAAISASLIGSRAAVVGRCFRVNVGDDSQVTLA